MSEYDNLLRDPGVWRSRVHGQIFVADLLMTSYEDLRGRFVRADLVAEEVALVGALAYHYGMALELATKAAIAEKTKSRPPLTHKLTDLCQEAGIELSPDEVELAERLTAAIEWWGRYSVPKKSEDYDRALASRVRRLSLPQDRHILVGLLDRLGVTIDTKSQ